jgi:hypothetical protein
VGFSEQAIVQAHFGSFSVGYTYPMNGTFYMQATGVVTRFRFRNIFAMHFGYFAKIIGFKTGAGYNVGTF